MCYGLIKCDDSDKQRLLCGLRHVVMIVIFSHIQMKLVDKSISIQRGISCGKWTFYQEKIEVAINYEEGISLTSLIVIQAYMKLYVMQG